jgi:hypothetical protein
MARGGKWAICSQNALMPHMGHEIYGRILSNIKAEIQQLRCLESEWDSGEGEHLVAMASDAIAALPMRFTLQQTHRSFSVATSTACQAP